MEIRYSQSEEGAKGLLDIWEGDQCMARMTYSRIDKNNVIIDHTAVDPRAKGKGYGSKIVRYMVDWARENEQKVLALCPFTKAAIERHPEYADILRK